MTLGERPLAVLVGGAPASGKSTLARALAPALGAALIDLDVATGPLTALVLDLIGASDLSEPRAAELTRAPRYDTLFALALDSLRGGVPVVLVAPFSAERAPSRWQQVERMFAPHASVRLVWMQLPGDELERRLAGRGEPRDTVKLQDPAAYLEALDIRLPEVPHLTLDATRPVAELESETRAWVRP